MTTNARNDAITRQLITELGKIANTPPPPTARAGSRRR